MIKQKKIKVNKVILMVLFMYVTQSYFKQEALGSLTEIKRNNMNKYTLYLIRLLAVFTFKTL